MFTICHRIQTAFIAESAMSFDISEVRSVLSSSNGLRSSSYVETRD